MSELLVFLLAQEDQFRRARLPSLYSEFQLQHASNPDGYAANAAAWETALAHAVEAGKAPGGYDVLSLRTGPELLRALETEEWGRPLALSDVINDAIYYGRMVPLNSFIHSSKSLYQQTWTMNPRWLFSWGFEQLRLKAKRSARDSLQSDQLVIIHNVERASRKVLDSIKPRENLADRILPINAFQEKVTAALRLNARISISDLSILLVYLSRDRQQIVYNDQVVKFKTSDDPSLSLSKEDIAIASLKSLINDLSLQLSQLTSSINELSQKARYAVMQKDRIGALASLRSKKLRESLYKNRYDTLFQLEGVYDKIEEAADQVKVIQVMKGSTDALKRLNAKVGGYENVENIIEGLREEMKTANDINDAIGDAGRDVSGLNEGEIDDELELLEKEQLKEIPESTVQLTNSKLEKPKQSASTQMPLFERTSPINLDDWRDTDIPATVASPSIAETNAHVSASLNESGISSLAI